MESLRHAVYTYVVPRVVGTKYLDEEEAFRLFANTEDLYFMVRKRALLRH